MYLAHYGLSSKPFQISTDPRFLWLGDKHREALAVLRYGVTDNKGFLLLTGDVGTGKTTLINALVESLGNDTLVATIPDPRLTLLDFYRSLMHAYGLTDECSNKADFLRVFNDFLRRAHQTGKKVLLIVDESQRLTPQLLQEVRVLSNIERPDTKLINIFFVGQNEFNAMLAAPQHRALRQRIPLSYQIETLVERETAAYIAHRLTVAGGSPSLFTAAAVQEIHRFSRGYPRLINIICDHALLSGFVRETKVIDADIVRECSKELQLPNSAVASTLILSPPPTAAPAAAAPPAAGPISPAGAAVSPAAAAAPPQPEPMPKPQAPPARPKRSSGRMAAALLLAGVFALLLASDYLPPGQVAWIDGLKERWTRFLQSGSAPAPPTAAPAPAQRAPAPVSSDAQAPARTEQAPSLGVAVSASPAVPATIAPTEPLRPSSIEPAFANNHGTIRFEQNSNEPSPEALQALEKLARYLAAVPNARVRISGHTDDTGALAYNISVSRFRANIVKTFLVGHGIASERIATEAIGPHQPIASNETREGREANRRVEIEVIPGKG